MKTFIIYNPIAGNKKSKKKFQKIVNYLEKNNIQFVFFKTKSRGEATKITKKITNNLGEKINLIAAGGDGTLTEVLNGVNDFDNVNLGILPIGSGNDFAKKLKLPQRPIKMIKKIIDGKYEKINFFVINNEIRVFNYVSTGLDIDVLNIYNKMERFKPKNRYKIAFLKSLMKIKWHNFEIEINGKKKKYNGLIATITNGSYYGGGLKIAPHADIKDGVLDAVIIKTMPKTSIPKLLMKFLIGKHIDNKYVETLKITKANIKTDCNAFSYDGEILKNKIIDIAISPIKINIYC